VTRAAWLADLRSAVADVDGVVRDLLRRPADRELGPVYHRQIYDEAAAKIAALLGAAPDDDSGDPAGSGGAGPVA
jgi:RNA polymerase-interacting CarD/CdnL/TRCF family regulator